VPDVVAAARDNQKLNKAHSLPKFGNFGIKRFTGGDDAPLGHTYSLPGGIADPTHSLRPEHNMSRDRRASPEKLRSLVADASASSDVKLRGLLQVGLKNPLKIVPLDEPHAFFAEKAFLDVPGMWVKDSAVGKFLGGARTMKWVANPFFVSREELAARREEQKAAEAEAWLEAHQKKKKGKKGEGAEGEGGAEGGEEGGGKKKKGKKGKSKGGKKKGKKKK
jgi:hypothetical protein